MLKKNIICFIFMFCLFAAYSSDVEISGFSSPESIVISGQYVYVSNVGEKLEPLTEDNDGYISRLTLSGKIIEEKYISNLNAPKGLAVIKNILFIVDIRRVIGFDLKKNKEVINLEINDSLFLNDIEPIGNNELLVSDTGLNKIFKINYKKQNYKMIDIEGLAKGPNGLFYNRKTKILYIVGLGQENVSMGEIGFISLKDEKLQYKSLSDERGFFDGVYMLNDEILSVSDWVSFEKKGRIVLINTKNNEMKNLDIDLIAGPADFYYDKKDNSLWIPKMLENKVIKISNVL